MPLLSPPCSRKERAATERMFSWFRALCSREYRTTKEYERALMSVKAKIGSCEGRPRQIKNTVEQCEASVSALAIYRRLRVVPGYFRFGDDPLRICRDVDDIGRCAYFGLSQSSGVARKRISQCAFVRCGSFCLLSLSNPGRMRAPGAKSTVMTSICRPGCSGIGFVRSGVTFCAVAVAANSEASISTRRFVILLIPSNIVRLRDDHQRRPLDADCAFPYRRA